MSLQHTANMKITLIRLLALLLSVTMATPLLDTRKSSNANCQYPSYREGVSPLTGTAPLGNGEIVVSLWVLHSD